MLWLVIIIDHGKLQTFSIVLFEVGLDMQHIFSFCRASLSGCVSLKVSPLAVDIRRICTAVSSD